MDLKEHWEKIYNTKQFEETSWYQQKPEYSLEIIRSLGLSPEANIIDIGGGNSFLVDHLSELGYANIHVLDISAKALQDSQNRLGAKAEKINWIESDVTNLKPDTSFELWHDRAALHFLTEDKQVEDYVSVLKNSLKIGAYCLLSVFSENGPDKCSGIAIRKYATSDLEELLEPDFDTVRLENRDHTTPWGAKQNFSTGLFRRK
ncbi:class I SAM-dependent methyltransferase [Christiangramia marina]|uniref:class I SAM-dependent methyltransferase n=1 Tax=Christiangramia marina TaxID=409436 RepID=UPI003AA83E61